MVKGVEGIIMENPETFYLFGRFADCKEFDTAKYVKKITKAVVESISVDREEIIKVLSNSPYGYKAIMKEWDNIDKGIAKAIVESPNILTVKEK